MKKNLESTFHVDRYMSAKNFELYYYNDYEPDKIALHTHDYYEFYFFLEGDISMQVGKQIFPVRHGDFMLIPPHHPHKALIHSTSTPYRRFVFWVSTEYYELLLKTSADYGYLLQYIKKNKTFLFHSSTIEFNTTQHKILLLIEELHAERFGKNAWLTLNVNDLILHLNRMIYEQNHTAYVREDELYRRLLLYINENIEGDLSLEHLSAVFYISKYYIAHVFKDNLGISIHQYITKKRLTLCREAILSSANISEIYQTFGFGDYSSFYRAFKKEFGISPKDFRDMYLNPCIPTSEESPH